MDISEFGNTEIIRRDRPLTDQDYEMIKKFENIYFKNFNHPIIIPPNVKKICLGHQFNQKLDNLGNIEELILGDDFNQPLDFLPSSLKKMVLGYSFNQPLLNLPPNLEDIHFMGHSKFNNQIILPYQLKSLTFGNNFEQFFEVNHKLEELYLGRNFNLKLDLKNVKTLGFNLDSQKIYSSKHQLKHVVLYLDPDNDKYHYLNKINNFQNCSIGLVTYDITYPYTGHSREEDWLVRF